MQFNLLTTDEKSKARAGELHTDNGVIETPIFMPVGTVGSVKGVHQHELEEDIKAQIILGNTYHLFMRPGMEVMEAAGGLHKFMNWNGPILTDSGGIQEEAPSLGKPVLVMRDTTERQEAIESGAVKLVGTNKNEIVKMVKLLLTDSDFHMKMSKAQNPYGDGTAGSTIRDILVNRGAV